MGEDLLSASRFFRVFERFLEFFDGGDQRLDGFAKFIFIAGGGLDGGAGFFGFGDG